MDETTEHGLIVGYPGIYAKNETQNGEIFLMPGKKGNALCTAGNNYEFKFFGVENSCFITPWRCAVNGMTVALWVLIPPLPHNLVNGTNFAFTDGLQELL